MLAKDVPGFMERFIPEMNPGVDLGSLTVGSATVITVCGIRKDLITAATHIIVNMIRTHNEYMNCCKLARDVSGFLDIFIKDKNPDTDINKLTTGSSKRIYWKKQNGEIGYSTVKSLVSTLRGREKAKVQKKESLPIDPEFLAVNIPGFSSIVPPELNPDIDYEKLRTSSKIKVNYITHKGKIGQYRTSYIVKKINDNAYSLPSIMRVLYKQAHGCSGINNQKDKQKDNQKDNRQDHVCDKGHKYSMPLFRYERFIANKQNPCPRCRIIKTSFINRGCMSIAEADPEMKLFWGSNKYSPEEISATSGHCTICLKCPYCGYEFTRKPKNIVGKHPKCPNCHDLGLDDIAIDYLYDPYIKPTEIIHKEA